MQQSISCKYLELSTLGINNNVKKELRIWKERKNYRPMSYDDTVTKNDKSFSLDF